MRISVSILVTIGLVCSFAAMMAQDCLAVDESLVLYLSFDGAVPEDLSLQGHDVELVGEPGHVNGKYGMAYEVSPDNYIMVPITDALQLREHFTVEYWVLKADAQPATWNYMVGAGTLVWAVILNADQNVYIYTSNPNWSNRLITDATLPEDWTHVAMTYDIDDAVKLFFNGELVGESDPQPAGMVEIDGSIMVGARHPVTEFFAGIIDEVILYNRVLSPDEIRQDMLGEGGLTAVSALDKLTSTWGSIKGF